MCGLVLLRARGTIFWPLIVDFAYDSNQIKKLLYQKLRSHVVENDCCLHCVVVAATALVVSLCRVCMTAFMNLCLHAHTCACLHGFTYVFARVARLKVSP